MIAHTPAVAAFAFILKKKFTVGGSSISRIQSLNPYGYYLDLSVYQDLYPLFYLQSFITPPPDPNLKYRRFNEVVSAMMDCFFPNKPTSVRESDKPWMTSSLKSSISKRQKSLHKYGRNSQAYRFWRNKVQRDVKVARRKYYGNSVQKLKSANPSRWWKEVKSIGGLSSRESWVYELLSEVNPTCEDLAES
jgi:hypothetical protein